MTRGLRERMGAALIGCWSKSSLVPSNMPMQRSDRWSQWRFLEIEVLLGKDMLYRSMEVLEVVDRFLSAHVSS